MDIHIICFTEAGERLALELRRQLASRYAVVTLASARRQGGVPLPGGMERVRLTEWARGHFAQGNALFFIGSCGIAVRAIAPLVADKASDPAVLVLDELGRFVIPLLSGHIGQANALARLVAPLTGGSAVLTTASDVRGLFAVDEVAARNGLSLSSRELAKAFAACLLRQEKARLFIPQELRGDITFGGALPPELELCVGDCSGIWTGEGAAFAISPYRGDGSLLCLVPRCLVLGAGCRRGKSAEELLAFAEELLCGQGLSAAAVAEVASLDVKRKEEGMIALAGHYGVPFTTFPAGRLRAVAGQFAASAFVERSVGVDNVCERAAMAAGASRLLVRKTARDGMTLAVGIRAVRIQF